MNGEPWLRPPVLVGLGLSLTAMGTSTFSTLGLGALAPYLRSALHLSTFEIGLLPALVFLGALSMSVPAGHLTDRVGAGRALAASQLVVALGIGIATVAPHRTVFMAGVLVAGIGYGAVNPATNVLSTSLVPRRRRAVFLSVKQAGVTFGGLVAGAALPHLADALGWRAALGIAISLLLCSAAAGLWVSRREAAGWFDLPATAAGGVERRVRVAVPGGFSTGVFGFLMSGVQLSVAGYLTVYLVDTQDFSPTTAGLALSVAFGAACVGRLLWGALSDRRASRHASTLVIVAVGSLAGLIGVGAGVGVPLLWLVIVIVGLCSMGWNGVYMALITDRAAGRGLGHATGRGLMALYSGVVVVPPVLGALRDATDSWTVTWAVATAAVLAAAVMLALAPRTSVDVGSGESGAVESVPV